MQTIYLEKNIDLHHQLKELISLSVDESIHYKMEQEGIRAIGNLMIKGEYKSPEKKTFEEALELDILATFDKIVDQRDFCIKVEDFDYTIKEGNLMVQIEAGVHGVISGENRYIREDPLQEIESLMEENQEEVAVGNKQTTQDTNVQMEPEELLVEETVEEPMQEEADPELTNPNESMEPEESDIQNVDPEELQEVVYESKTRPIFQDTGDSVGVYYLYVTKSEDSYETVANHYQVDEMALREYNQNRELENGSILIIPYIP